MSICVGLLGPAVYLCTNPLNLGWSKDLIRKIKTFSTNLDTTWTEESTLGADNNEIGKKFLLIGVNGNKEVKLAGLISIVVAKQGPWYKCNEQVKAQDISFENHDQGWEQIKSATRDTGLWFEGQKQLSLSGRIAFGNCKDEFYKGDGEVEVIHKLTGEGKKQTGLQKLSVAGGMHITQFTNVKHKSNPITTPGILNKNNTSGNNGKTLWAGLQGDGKVKRTIPPPKEMMVKVSLWYINY